MKQLKSAIQIVAITLGIMFGTPQKSEAANPFYYDYYTAYTYYLNLYYSGCPDVPVYNSCYNNYYLGHAIPYYYYWVGAYFGDFYGVGTDKPGRKSSTIFGGTFGKSNWSYQMDYYAYTGDSYWITYNPGNF